MKVPFCIGSRGGGGVFLHHRPPMQELYFIPIKLSI